MTRNRWMVSICACVALILTVSACSGPATTPDVEIVDVTTFVGDVGDDLFIAFDVMELAGGEEPRAVTAYLCDGVGVSVWLGGGFSGDEVALASGDTHIELSVAETVSGTLVLEGGAPMQFTATPVADQSEADLYRAEETIDGVDYVGGWIVLEDGRQKGAVAIALGEVLENPTLDLSNREASTSVGTFSACCCGVVFPCRLECCLVRF